MDKEMGTSLRILCILVLYGIIGVRAVYNATCYNNRCSCCRPGSTSSDSVCDTHRKCHYGCKDGYYGNICYNMCPASCVNCALYLDDHFNTYYIQCNECADGYYQDSSSYQACSNKCSTHCKSNICDKTTGHCECSSKQWTGDKCDTCASGNYGVNCEPCPENCYNGYCDLATGVCSYGCIDERFTGQRCDVCQSGLYGDNCDKTCPYDCKDNVCNRQDGTCAECKNNFAGSTCEDCIDYKYGDNCDKRCDRCLNGQCDRQTGVCGDCIPDYYGDNCDKRCYRCLNGQCDRQTGLCEDCIPDYFGDMCDKMCYSCLNGQCDRQTGVCVECPSNRHGQYCNLTCATGCRDYKCHRYNATCTLGCRSGYSGDKCCIYSTYCELCDTTSTCSKCISGRWGTRCYDKCPSFCDADCEKSSGNCTSCRNGFYGNKCTFKCPENCFNSKCNIQSGNCDICTVGFHGKNCTQQCPENCFNNVCIQDGGQCAECIVGYYGPTCNQSCDEECLNNSCVQSTGVCTSGCVNGITGVRKCPQAVVSPHNSPSSPVGAAVGGAIGGLVIILVIVVGVWFIYRRRSQQQNRRQSTAKIPSLKTLKQEEDKNIYENEHANIGETNKKQKSEKKKSKSALKTKLPTTEPNVLAVEKSLAADAEPHVAAEEPRVAIVALTAVVAPTAVVLPAIEASVDDNAEYYQFGNRIRVVELYEFVTNRTRELFSEEFEKHPKLLIKPYTVAQHSDNIGKNRYNGIYPYDHTRVTIKGDKQFFINACYIKGYRQEKAYIACLGPTKPTTDNFASFWRMVWHEKSDVIVMLTNLREATGMKCEQYWPELGESMSFPKFELRCDRVEDYAEYTIRTFTLIKGSESRVIQQLHFTAWPDKGVPDNVTCMVEFRQRVRTTSTMSKGPVIVHCSAGVGRTGTYIAIDILTQQGQTEGSVDVFTCVRDLREQRVNMVQTTEQYIYVHRAIVHTLTFDTDNTPAETFNEYVQSMTDTTYDAMFKKLCKSVEERSSDEQEAVKANAALRDKNRPDSDIPGDRNRPRLYLNRTFNESSYINAVYINGFKTKNEFILAQTPLPSTITDFICLTYQENCSCIVSLDDMTDHREDIGYYIPPDNQAVTHGPFVVSSTQSESTQTYQLRKIKIVNNGKQSAGERTIHHYQYTGWARGNTTPTDSAGFVEFVQAITQEHSTEEQESSPILIHCLTGGKRGGLFCAVSLLMEKADILHQISVTNTVRQIRQRRPNVICNKEQLKFLHECVSTKMETCCTYTNVAM